ncbi:MAG: inositol monophosphatase [Chloroflexota bacterium]
MKQFLPVIIELHKQIRAAVVAACESSALEQLSEIAEEEDGDTIYAIDKISEERLVAFFEERLPTDSPIVLVGEGINGGEMVLPRAADGRKARWRIIVDPIDGTRGLMYQKRSAWILTGVAPNRGAETNLQDIELAVQTEIPLIKQHLADQIWAIRGEGVEAVQHNRLTGEDRPLQVKPSQAATIAHGFASVSRFFPGVREELAAIDEEIVIGALGPVQPGKTHCFEDQYISTGGQLFELMAGRDRFIADFRPVMEQVLAKRGLALGICCHPYDICTELIARELGVIVTDEYGEPLSAPLDVDSNVSWVGYANAKIQAEISPLLRAALERRGLI